MAAPRLTRAQRTQVLEWIAADYDTGLIFAWMKEKDWPVISRRTMFHYRKHYTPTINELREQRYKDAMSTGLALKEERIKRLIKHADQLEEFKFTTNKSGALVNEKAWRETLNQIAEEVGDKKANLIPSEIVVRFVKSNEQD